MCVPDPFGLGSDLAVEQLDLVIVVLGAIGVAEGDKVCELGLVLGQAGGVWCR